MKTLTRRREDAKERPHSMFSVRCSIFGVLFLLFLLTTASAQARLEWRLQVTAITSNNAAAVSLAGQVRSAISPTEIADPRNRGFNAEARESTDSKTVVTATYILKDEATATNALARLKNLRTPQFTGVISLHCCPADGAIRDWAGCAQDPRAKYQEVLW